MFIRPAVAGKLVYVGSCSGRFLAFDAATGDTVWSHDTAADGPAAQFHGDALLTDDLVVVGSDARPQAHLYAFDRTTGEVRWEHAFPGGVETSVLRHDDTVLVVTPSAEVVAVELATGRWRWQVDDGPVGARGTLALDPALAGGRLFVPWRPGVMDAYDATTSERLWRRRLETTLNTSALVVGDEVWVGSIEGELLRLRAADGELLARHPLGDALYGYLVAAPGCVVVLRVEGEAGGPPDFGGSHGLACLDPRSGTERWGHRIAGEWGTFRPLVRDGEVIAGLEGKLLGLALSDGSLRWERAVPGLPRGLGTSQRFLYVGTLAGRILALPWRRDGGAP